MTSEQTAGGPWQAEATDGGPERPGATVSGQGHRFILLRPADATALAAILNAQTAALAEAAVTARRYDCGKTSLQKAAMVPCLNLPKGAACYACELTKARFERNSYCICDDDDELPTGPADYCPVHGNTYKYVRQEEAHRRPVHHRRAPFLEEPEEKRNGRQHEAHGQHRVPDFHRPERKGGGGQARPAARRRHHLPCPWRAAR